MPMEWWKRVAAVVPPLQRAPMGRATEGRGEQPTPGPLEVAWGGQWHPNCEGPGKEMPPAPLVPWPALAEALCSGHAASPPSQEGVSSLFAESGGCRAHPSPGHRHSVPQHMLQSQQEAGTAEGPCAAPAPWPSRTVPTSLWRQHRGRGPKPGGSQANKRVLLD